MIPTQKTISKFQTSFFKRKRKHKNSKHVNVHPHSCGFFCSYISHHWSQVAYFVQVHTLLEIWVGTEGGLHQRIVRRHGFEGGQIPARLSKNIRVALRFWDFRAKTEQTLKKQVGSWGFELWDVWTKKEHVFKFTIKRWWIGLVSSLGMVIDFSFQF